MKLVSLFPPPPPRLASAGLLLLRLVAGTAFMFHGWSKIQNPFEWMGPGAAPGILQALAALSEFGGGLAWILGALVPLASLGIFFTMAVATFFHAVVKGDPFVGQAGSYELALLYLAISVVMLTVGPGLYSVDAWLRRKLGAAPTGPLGHGATSARV